jgi:Mrp family chromosome partitioning ATPase
VSRLLERTALLNPAAAQDGQSIDGVEPNFVLTDDASASPHLHDRVSQALAEADAIRTITERLGALAIVETPLRVFISGCRPGDGASTMAAALAIDLSERLGVRTALIDANLKHPSLKRLFPNAAWQPWEPVLNGSPQAPSSEWPRLEFRSLTTTNTGSLGQELVDHFRTLLGGYAVAVVDVGVARLDARMLQLARSADPILLVVRYGRTERQELVNTVRALRAANRSVAGVILNDATDPVRRSLRRLLGR